MIFNVSSSLGFFEFTCSIKSIIFTVKQTPLLPGTLFPQTLLPGKFLLCFWNITVLSAPLNSLQWFPKVNYSLLSAPTTHFAFTSRMGLNPIIIIYKYLPPSPSRTELLETYWYDWFCVLSIIWSWCLFNKYMDYTDTWVLPSEIWNLFGPGSSLGISDLRWGKGENLLSEEVNTCIHTYIHTHMHTHAHTHIHTCTHTTWLQTSIDPLNVEIVTSEESWGLFAPWMVFVLLIYSQAWPVIHAREIEVPGLYMWKASWSDTHFSPDLRDRTWSW